MHPVSTVAHRRDRNRDHADPHPPAPAERPGEGQTPDAILDDYPDLEADDIRACAAYAQEVITRDTLSAVSVAK